MVASILSLRFKSMGHLMAREWWRALVLVAGAVWAFTLLPAIYWGRYSLAATNAENRAFALVSLGFVFVLGWALVPMLVAGADDTLDARRFAPLGASVRRIFPGLLVAAMLTIPAVFFFIVLVLLTSSWFREGALIGWLGVLGGIVQVLSLIAIAKLVSAWTARVFANRRARLTAFAVSGVAFVGIVYVAWRALGEGLESLFESTFTVFIDAIAVTPVVSALSAPEAAAMGDAWGATWRMVLGVLWTAALVLAWRANVDHALVTPVYRSPGGRPRTDAIARGGAFAAALTKADRDGVAGAVFARVIRYWRTDPRYFASLVTVILMPALFVVVIIPSFDLDPRWAIAAPFVLATSVGWGRHNDVAYDASALWLDIVAGRHGGAVMRGRFAAVVVWALPLVVATSVAVVAFSGHWELAPAVVGAAVGALGVSLGVAALTSVTLPYRTAAPGENPFGAEVGSVGAGLVGQLASSVATLVLLPLVIVPCVLAVAVDARWGIVACIGGIAFGTIAYVYGLVVAGRIYDSRSGRLLAAVT